MTPTGNRQGQSAKVSVCRGTLSHVNIAPLIPKMPMHAFRETSWWQIVLGAIAIASLGICGLASAATVSKPRVAVTRQTARRPANLYQMALQTNRAICGTVLASLNKPVVLPLDANHVNLANDLFLGSDLQVPWQRKLVGPNGNLDHVDVDLANDGHVISLYRNSVLRFYKRSEDDLFVLEKPDPIWEAVPDKTELVTSGTKTADALDALEAKSSINFFNVDRQPLKGIIDQIREGAPSLIEGNFVTNVLSVHGRSLLLLASANEADAAYKGSDFHVFAFFYRVNAAPSLVCMFRGGL